MNAASFFETADGAQIYYEDHGHGQPIFLVHGWLCCSHFWQRNVSVLAERFRVVTIDLRGHGNSSKTLSGHTIAQYARDVRLLIEQLGLRDVFLVGWSLGGSVVLSYYEQFCSDAHLSALGLVDCSPYPISPGVWNSHVLRDFRVEALHASLAALAADPRKFAVDFTMRMFKQRPADADVEWIVAEMLKTPPWIGEAIYSNFVMNDLFKTLATVKVPLLVCSGDSGVFSRGIAMGKFLAAEAPHGRCVPFEEGGHILFYEQAEKFNAALAEFADAL